MSITTAEEFMRQQREWSQARANIENSKPSAPFITFATVRDSDASAIVDRDSGKFMIFVPGGTGFSGKLGITFHSIKDLRKLANFILDLYPEPEEIPYPYNPYDDGQTIEPGPGGTTP